MIDAPDLLKNFAEDHHLNMKHRGNTWHRGEFSECLAETCVCSRETIDQFAAEFTRLQQIEEAARRFLPKRHLPGCAIYRFSDRDKRHCSCGWDELAAALEKLA